MNFQAFEEAVLKNFGNGTDFKDLTREQYSLHKPNFSARVVVDKQEFLIRLSNPYGPTHWNAWVEVGNSDQALIADSGDEALAELAKSLGAK